MSPERYQDLLVQFGYNRPIYIQYFDYVWRLLQGDFGLSISTKRSVLQEFLTLFPATLELSSFAMLFAISVGVPAGIFAAVRRGSWFDQITMGVALTGYSMPIFWWGLLLIIFFSGTLQWTPVSGRISLLYFFEPVTGFMLIDSFLSGQKGAFTSAVQHLILPSIVLATIPLAVIARQTRSAMLEVLSEDYVRTARAKGLSELSVLFSHVLRNALVPILTGVVVVIPLLFMGSLITESFFSIPGLGSYTIDAINSQDFSIVRAMVFLGSVLYILGLILTDISYTWVDPRVRL